MQLACLLLGPVHPRIWHGLSARHPPEPIDGGVGWPWVVHLRWQQPKETALNWQVRILWSLYPYLPTGRYLRCILKKKPLVPKFVTLRSETRRWVGLDVISSMTRPAEASDYPRSFWRLESILSRAIGGSHNFSPLTESQCPIKSSL